MSSILAHLPLKSHIFPSGSKSQITESVSQSISISSTPSLKWDQIQGPVQENLFPELQKIYWNGVRRELAHILLTLRQWQQPNFASTILADEEDDFIHGFDTFVDQVSEKSRDFAERYDRKAAEWNSRPQVGYKAAFIDLGKDYQAEMESARIKIEIRNVLQGNKFKMKSQVIILTICRQETVYDCSATCPNVTSKRWNVVSLLDQLLSSNRL